MRNIRAVGKVTALITRLGVNGPELLVFQHPLAGIQLPAGTVEIGESVAAALQREVQEETGLIAFDSVQPLGTQTTILSDDQRILLRLSKLFDSPAFDASSLPFTLTRGTIVRLLQEVGEGGRGRFAQVCYEQYDLAYKPPQLHQSFSGWVRSSILSRHIERHFFHLTHHSPTPTTWQVETDNHTFYLFWVSLTPRPQLVYSQQLWLDTHYEPIMAYYQGNLSTD
ncbi:MAG: NUDIX domain-containing protein [Anaerolineae bacterium]|nr:NUDIX domain-containing protein [Anaerolineae bacterium]